MKDKKKKARRTVRLVVPCEKQSSEKQDMDLGCSIHRRVGCMGMGVYP